MLICYHVILMFTYSTVYLLFYYVGLTPVHLASSLPTSDMLATICDIVGSDVLELTDASGLTPLMHACVNGNEACIDFIVKKKVWIKSPFLFHNANCGKYLLSAVG